MRRYPLSSLSKLRRQQVDASTAELATTTHALREATELKEREARQLARECIDHRALSALERGRLAGGGARAADLATLGSFERGATHREQRRRERLLRAEEQEGEALRARERARLELERAEARRIAMNRHEAAFRVKEQGAMERQQEQEALEVHAAARHRRGGR